MSPTESTKTEVKTEGVQVKRLDVLVVGKAIFSLTLRH